MFTTSPVSRRATHDSAEQGECVRIEIVYDKGGANYFSGGRDPRGYSVHFTKIEKRGRTVSFMPFSDANLRVFVKPAARYSLKDLDLLVQRLDRHCNALVKMYQEEGPRAACGLVREILGLPAPPSLLPDD